MFQTKLSGKKLFDFYKTLSLFDKNSVPMVQGIQYLSESDPKNQTYKKMLKKAANTSKLSNILEGFIPKKDLDYFKVAEGHGGISTMLLRLEDIQRLEMSLKEDLYKSMAMPSILFIVCLIMIVGYGTNVLPAFQSILPVEEWPAISSSLLGMANFLTSIKAIFTLFFICLLGYMLVNYIKTDNSKFRSEVLDNFPVFKLYKSFLAFSFLNKFYFLIEMGIGYHDALKIINETSTGRMKFYLDQMILNGGDNSNVNEVINVGLIESQDVILMGMFSKNRSFDAAISIAVDRCTVSLQNNIAVGGNTFKFLMLIIVAMVILWTYLSVNLLVLDFV